MFRYDYFGDMSVTGTVQQHDLLRVKDRYALKKIFQPFIFLLRSFRDGKKVGIMIIKFIVKYQIIKIKIQNLLTVSKILLLHCI